MHSPQQHGPTTLALLGSRGCVPPESARGPEPEKAAPGMGILGALGGRAGAGQRALATVGMGGWGPSGERITRPAGPVGGVTLGSQRGHQPVTERTG